MINGLFRQEALEYHTNRLQGDVLLLPLFSHTLLIALLLMWCLAAIVWLMSSNYARKETITGWLEPPEGVIRVYAEDTGVIKQVLVKEGDAVVADQPLIIVNGDRVLADGDHLEIRLLEEYQNQQQLLTDQLLRTTDIHQGRERDIVQRIAAAKQDLQLLNEQLITLNERHTLIKTQVDRYRRLQLDGHVSSADVDNAIAQELDLRGEQQSLLREQLSQQNLIQQLQTDQQLLPQENANSIDQLRTRLSDIAQQMAQLHGRRAHIIKASRAGIVNNLQAREGLQAYSGSSIPLLTLMPTDSELTVQLLIPVRSVGFVKQGQQLDIRYDAFPYQKFGLYQGKVISVSETVLLPNELLTAPVQVQDAVYRVTASLSRPHVQAYGKIFPLKPGMTLSADIRLHERSLLQWLLEPIYSLKGRL